MFQKIRQRTIIVILAIPVFFITFIGEWYYTWSRGSKFELNKAFKIYFNDIKSSW